MNLHLIDLDLAPGLGLDLFEMSDAEIADANRIHFAFFFCTTSFYFFDPLVS